VIPYADSSFIVAIYVPGDNDPFSIWRQIGSVPLPFNPMHRLEVRNAIRRRVTETRPDLHIDHSTAQKALRSLDTDVGSDLLHQPIAWTSVLRRAEELGAQYVERTSVRAYDLFHLAAAVETGHDAFLTFDHAQGAAASLMGLHVLGI
jgi:predicted nucleic acid-binding protein